MATTGISQPSDKTLLLIAGAGHGTWCWEKIVPLLQSQGHKVIAVEVPGSGNDTAKIEYNTLDEDVKAVFLNFQIVFQPTALFQLTGIPSHELANKYVDAKDIFSNNISSFFEELQQAKSYDEMLEKAEGFVGILIRNKKKEPHQLDTVSRLMIQQECNVSIDWLAKETNLCVKQFKRKFNERAGINPKTFAKIIRFNKAYNIRNAHPDWDWLKVAIECNYYDYQHLVKDYHHFTGLNPNELHQVELKSPESRLGLVKELYLSRIKPL